MRERSEMSTDYDVIVIGGARGERVAVVERDLVGSGTAEVDVEAAFGWRDLVVSDYSDASKRLGPADHRINEIYLAALKALHGEIATTRPAAGMA